MAAAPSSGPPTAVGSRSPAARRPPARAPTTTPVAVPTSGPSAASRLRRSVRPPGTSTPARSATAATSCSGAVLAGRARSTASVPLTALSAVVPAAPAAAPFRSPRMIVTGREYPTGGGRNRRAFTAGRDGHPCRRAGRLEAGSAFPAHPRPDPPDQRLRAGRRALPADGGLGARRPGEQLRGQHLRGDGGGPEAHGVALLPVRGRAGPAGRRGPGRVV